LGTTVESGALVESVSAIGRLSIEGDLWLGRAGVQPLALPVFSFIFERRRWRNKIEQRFEETNKVKRRIYFVKQKFFRGRPLIASQAFSLAKCSPAAHSLILRQTAISQLH
jgi:hypothetical protein